MVPVADLLSGLLAFVFGSAAIGKLLRQRQQVQTAEKLRIPWHRYRWIAAPEAASSNGRHVDDAYTVAWERRVTFRLMRAREMAWEKTLKGTSPIRRAFPTSPRKSFPPSGIVGVPGFPARRTSPPRRPLAT